MQPSSPYKNLIQALDLYQSKVMHYSPETYMKSPGNGKWSLGQVYSHIITANQLTVRGMYKCLRGEARHTTEKPRISARMILLLGFIPPLNLQVPRIVEEATPQLSREEAFESLKKLKDDLHSIMNAPEWPVDLKFKHPFLGPMNIKEWMRFMQIHTRHHLRQITRTEKALHI